ncbi:MAG: hypothetical protein ACRC3H_04325 [Lachnospiraceae bacterium]
MKHQKNIAAAITVFLLLLLTSCNMKAYENVMGTEIAETNYTPEETVSAALNYLKEADINKFNQYVCYPTSTQGTAISAYNIMFSNDPDEDTVIFIETIMSNLVYEIVDVQEHDSFIIINTDIINKDLSDIDIFSYADAEDPLLEAVKNSDTELITTNIDIELIQKDDMWKIVVDNDFKMAVSGGLF